MADEQDSWFKPFGFDPGKAAADAWEAAKAKEAALEQAAREKAAALKKGAEQFVKDPVGTVVEGGKKLIDEGKKKIEEAKGAAKKKIEEAKGAVNKAVKTVAGAISGGGKPGSVSALAGSVGAGGKNLAEDVMAVQSALGIGADGKCGQGTIGAIIAFQKKIGLAKPDGRIDPGGQTAKALAAGGKADDGGIISGFKKLVGSALGAGAQADVSLKLPALPQFKKLTPEQAAACEKFLTDHNFTAIPQANKPGTNFEEYQPALDGKPTTIDGVVSRLGPLTLLNPVAELRELVMARYTPLVNKAIQANLLPGPNNLGVRKMLAPTVLIAKAGKGRVKLKWRAAPGAKSYQVYRSEVSGASGGPLRTVSATAFTDTGVTNGTTYFYRVTANTDGGESASSPEASATPRADAGPQAELEVDTEVKTRVKWDVAFKAHDDEAHVQVLPGAEIEVAVDEAGNSDSVAVNLNIIKVRLERELRLTGKVEIEATVKLVTKGQLAEPLFKMVQVEVEGEVEIKLKHIALKASATIGPHGVEPGFGIVLWRW